MFIEAFLSTFAMYTFPENNYELPCHYIIVTLIYEFMPYESPESTESQKHLNDIHVSVSGMIDYAANAQIKADRRKSNRGISCKNK